MCDEPNNVGEAGPRYGARVFSLPGRRILGKQTVKRGPMPNDDYVIDDQRERHVDRDDDAAVANAIRDSLAGRIQG